MIKIRDYQEACIVAIWRAMVAGDDDQLIQLPTGSGKTIIFVELIRRLLEKYLDLRINILVNKIKLVEQTKDKLLYLLEENQIGLYCGSLGEYQDKNSVTVGAIMTISSRTHVYNVMIIDEAHNAEGSSTYKNYIKRCKEANPRLKVIRFTATPYTMNGYIYGEDKPIKKLTYKRTLNQMVAEGHLVKFLFKNTKESFDTSQLSKKRGDYILREVEEMSKDEEKCHLQVKDAMPRLQGRRKIVWSATCIEHALILKKEIEQFEPCSVVHSKLTSKERVENLQLFETGSVRHLVSIMIVTEGYDYPPIDAIVIMRPTRSPILYVQLAGRGARPIYAPGFDLDTIEGRLAAIAASDKPNCLILDYGEVVEYFGHPSDPYIPNAGMKKSQEEKRVIICPACDTINFLPRKECTSCGYQFTQAEKKEIQRTKALTNQAADVELNENGHPEFILDVILCETKNNYVTKKGAVCLKVTYTTMSGPVHEYLKMNTYYHRKWNSEMLLHKKTPVRIRVEKRGKYLELIERIY